MRGFWWISLLMLMMTGVVHADITIVDDNFDAYADDAAFDSVWIPSDGSGLANPIATSGPIGILVPRTVSPFPPPPYDGSADPTTMPPVPPVDDPLTPEVEKAVAFSDFGNINEWDDGDGDRANDPFQAVLGRPLVPSATESVRVQADLFNGGGDFGVGSGFNDANRRFSVGLRNDLAQRPDLGFGWNFLEMGFWNSDTCDPTNPNCDTSPAVTQNSDDEWFIPTTSYGYRLTLFGDYAAPLLDTPEYQFFELPPEFDDPLIDHNNDGRFGNGDGIVNYDDIGPGWHRFSATISESEIILQLDLFQDGSIDAEQTWGVTLANDTATGEPAPFTSLRIGGISGGSINTFSMVDNVKLELLEEMPAVDGDFNNDGEWNCLDINALVAEIVAGTNSAVFDMNGDGVVDRGDITDGGVGWLAVGGANNTADTDGFPFLEGDANLDGSVDVSDFNVWNGSKFTSKAEWCSGDFSADGSVDVSDFNIWNGNKFQSSSGGTAMVPEPTSALLVVVSGLVLAWLHRRS